MASRPRWKRLTFIPDSEAATDPAANLAALRDSLEKGEVTPELHAAFERTERALERLAEGFRVTQPAGAFDVFSVRWWRQDGSRSVLRTPVLVRMRRFGGYRRPVRVKSRAVHGRRDGEFALNADLVERLVAAYWQEYRAWSGLKDLWTEYRWWRKRLAVADGKVAEIEDRFPTAAILRTARGRVEASGKPV